MTDPIQDGYQLAAVILAVGAALFWFLLGVAIGVRPEDLGRALRGEGPPAPTPPLPPPAPTLPPPAPGDFGISESLVGREPAQARFNPSLIDPARDAAQAQLRSVHAASRVY